MLGTLIDKITDKIWSWNAKMARYNVKKRGERWGSEEGSEDELVVSSFAWYAETEVER